MNDKIRELLKNAEQSDAIAKNKWRIENREQLRKERKEKLKELMEKDKQQTAVRFERFKELFQVLPSISIYQRKEKYVIGFTWLVFGLIINIFKGEQQ
jgi:hypothetical protein